MGADMTRIGRVLYPPIPSLTSPTGLGGTTPQPGLDDLSDVDTSGVTDGDALIWDDGAQLWVPGSGSGVSEITDIPTSETDTSLVLHPDGAGGVEWGTDATGGGGSGSYVWLQRQTASASATLDFTGFISSTYTAYVFVLQNLLNATNNQHLLLVMGTGAGPTWDTSGVYQWGMQDSGGGGGFALGAAGATAIRALHDVNNGTSLAANGSVTLYAPSSSVYKAVTTHGFVRASDGQYYEQVGGGSYHSTTPVTGIRFLFASGNITSGDIDVYGLTHA